MNNFLYGVTEKYDVLFAKIAIFIVHVHVYASISFVPVAHVTWMKHLYHDYTCLYWEVLGRFHRSCNLTLSRLFCYHALHSPLLLTPLFLLSYVCASASSIMQHYALHFVFILQSHLWPWTAYILSGILSNHWMMTSSVSSSFYFYFFKIQIILWRCSVLWDDKHSSPYLFALTAQHLTWITIFEFTKGHSEIEHPQGWTGQTILVWSQTEMGLKWK